MLNHIVELEQADEKFNRALKDFGETDFSSFASKEPSYLVGWLNEAMGLKEDDETISWWLWDAPNAGNCDEQSCTVTFDDQKQSMIIKKADDVYDLIVAIYPKPKTPDDGVDFALDIIAMLQATNKTTHNDGWQERDALLEYVYNKVKDEWMLKHGNRE